MAPLKEVDKLSWADVKREAVLRGVFKVGQGTTGMKNAVKEHREANPEFDLVEAAQKVLEKNSKNKSPDSSATPAENKTGDQMAKKTKGKKAAKKKKVKKVAKKAVTKKAKAPAKKKAAKKVAEVKPKVEAKTNANPPKEGEHGAIRAHIMQLYAAGKKPAEIEKETGYNKNTIYGTGQHYRKSLKKAKE